MGIELGSSEYKVSTLTTTPRPKSFVCCDTEKVFNEIEAIHHHVVVVVVGLFSKRLDDKKMFCLKVGEEIGRQGLR